MTIPTPVISSGTPTLSDRESISRTGWSKEQATAEAVNQLMIQKFTEIVSSYQQRKNSNSLEALATGPWYANDYAIALQKRSQGNRFGFLKKNNSFYHGFPPEGFTKQQSGTSPTGIKVHSYRISADCLPTQALENAKTGRFSFIDCGIAIEVAIYETLREVLGDEAFNELFSGKGPTPLALHPDILETPLHSLGFITEFKFEEQEASPNPGDLIYFANLPLYRVKHVNGESKGFNTICISPAETANKKYIAFGMPLEGKTESEITDLLVDAFNKQPIDSSFLYAQYLVDHFAKEGKPYEEHVFQETRKKVSEFIIDREMFETVAQSPEKKAGIASFCRRLNIQAIHTQFDQRISS